MLCNTVEITVRENDYVRNSLYFCRYKIVISRNLNQNECGFTLYYINEFIIC